MQENLILDETNTLDGYQIIVTGINWHKSESLGKYRSKKDFSEKLPEQITLVLPENIASKESFKDFYDIVETWVYNFLAKRFNYIANRCQIWLPLKDESVVA
jgi:hypothetical protein